MLLPSQRHTQTDLGLWVEFEQADLVHYQTANVASKAERAVHVMGSFLADGPCYAAVSWGKDSVVLAHLVWCSGLPLTLANVAQTGPGADPHIPDVCREFLSRFPCPYHEVAVPLEAIPDTGGHSPALDIGIKQLQDYFGTRRYIGGIRAAESGIRKIGLRTRGLTTERTCQPLGWWSVADVFAYLAHHHLPVHPNYAMLGGGRWQRDQIRVSTIGGPKGNQFGRAEWEAEYYGDVLRRLQARR